MSEAMTPDRVKKRILFVDDDAALLTGLRNVLWRDRRRWEMVFAVGGRQALDELRQQSFDVVVSDMRMPDVDGATLLHLVQRESPRTARILLSGQADDDDLDRARPVLHQFLTKPCQANTLRAALEHQLAAHTTSGDGCPHE